jgi:hypothetical protein
MLFLALSTQWMRSMSGLPTGLNYAALEPAARMMDIAMSSQLFTDIRSLEAGALSYFAERARKS